MSIRKFKFVSPGVFINEIDNSQRPATPEPVGPIVIGRTERGPAMRPVQVDSFSDFVEVFGNPIAGGQGGDIWRDGNYTSPTYASYAAQAWLRNNSPCTMVRLLGTHHPDAGTAGKAGWTTTISTPTAHEGASGGAFGLFVVNSSSIGTTGGKISTVHTGTLAAIFYLNEGSVAVSGTTSGQLQADSNTTASAAQLIASIGSGPEFRVEIRNAANNREVMANFNFNETSDKYIRKVFNTNPTLTNSDLVSSAKTYWLGETYERQVKTMVTGSNAWGFILGMGNATSDNHAGGFRQAAQKGSTGWAISQDLGQLAGYNPNAMQKLFRFHTLNDGGEWECQNLKISIVDIKAPTNDFEPYGTFSVLIRRAQDTDGALKIVERFSSCNLNPASANYIAKKVGDRYAEWDATERRYREYGAYDNNSKFVRVEVNSDVDAGTTAPAYLPFGFYGPTRFKGFNIIGSQDTAYSFGQTNHEDTEFTTVYALGNKNIPRSAHANHFVSASADFTGSFEFPSVPLRTASLDTGLGNSKNTFWGIDTGKKPKTVKFNPGYKDLVRSLGTQHTIGTDSEYAWIFSLDDLKRAGTTDAAWVSGSRALSASFTSGSWKKVLDNGFDRFTMCLSGGFDGLNIKEKDPFRNAQWSSPTEKTSYSFHSIKRAIDSVRDPEVVECNLITIPGITDSGLTDHLLTVCEDRADALAIIDLKGDYVPSHENTSTEVTRVGNVDTTISNLQDRALNSSYGCVYYPWIQIRDTINGATLWAPPSIVALGTMASSERKSELWFAPAGFTRGGLTVGSAGVPVIGVREKLTSKERDKLYEANINPIASFPAEGIVIFGQKTLQVTPSALDRVNVRRLMIFIKKEISRIAATLLFDQNVRRTWNRFIGRAEPLLRSIETRLGLTDFKIVLDETTTTPDLVDRNIMYAKIFLKPARAIEFIAIDFVITDSGASFED